MQNHIHSIWSWRLRVNKSVWAGVVLPNWRGDVRVLVYGNTTMSTLTHAFQLQPGFRALDGAGLNVIRVPDSRLR